MKALSIITLLFLSSLFSCSDSVGDISGQWEFYAYYCDRSADFDVRGFRILEDTIVLHDLNWVTNKYSFDIERDTLVLLGEYDTLRFSISRSGDTLLIDSTFYVKNDTLDLGKGFELLGIESELRLRGSEYPSATKSFGVVAPLNSIETREEAVKIRAGDKIVQFSELPLYLDLSMLSHRRPFYIDIYPHKDLILKQYWPVVNMIRYFGRFRLNTITNKPTKDKKEGFWETKQLWEEEQSVILDKWAKKSGAFTLPPPPPPSTRISLEKMLMQAKSLSIIHINKKGGFLMEGTVCSFPDDVMVEDDNEYLFVFDENIRMEIYAQFRIELQRYIQDRRDYHARQMYGRLYDQLEIDQKNVVANNCPIVFFVSKSLYDEITVPTESVFPPGKIHSLGRAE
jgi:hypothetical protein